MDDYDKRLNDMFKGLEINLVKHDTSACGMPAYIEAHLSKMPKDKGAMVLDLGNYIYRRYGLRYRMTPEYRGRGKKTTLRWFMSWDDIQPIRASILRAHDKSEGLLRHRDYLPFEFRVMAIQKPREGETWD